MRRSLITRSTFPDAVPRTFLTAFRGHDTVSLHRSGAYRAISVIRIVIDQQQVRRFTAYHGVTSSCDRDGAAPSSDIAGLSLVCGVMVGAA